MVVGGRVVALRSVAQLPSRRLELLHRAEQRDATSARALLDTVSRLRRAAQDSDRVAGEAGLGVAVVADEVEEPARETAEATHRVSEQLADTRSSSRSVAAGTGGTGRVVGELDAVRADTAAVLSEQEQPAGEHGR